jgi:Mg-chelatase subunit ChlD
VLIGGWRRVTSDDGAQPTEDVLVYDPAADRWTSAGTAPRQRAGASGAAVLGNRLFLTGGGGRDGLPVTQVDTAQLVGTGAGAQAKLDLVLALDSSGSLQGTDPENMRSEGAATVLFNIPFFVDVRTGVVDFDSNSKVVTPLGGPSAALRAVRQLDQSGGTDISGGLAAALAELTGPRARAGAPKRVILFTDGKQEDGPFDWNVVAQLASRQIPVYALQLGNDREGAELLGEVARRTGGRHERVTDPNQLPGLFGEVFRGFQDGTAVRSDDPRELFLIADGKRHRLPDDEETVLTLGVNPGDVQSFPAASVRTVPAGKDIPTLRDGDIVKAEGQDALYLLENRSRRFISDAVMAATQGLDRRTRHSLPATILARIKEGSPVPLPAVATDRAQVEVLAVSWSDDVVPNDAYLEVSVTLRNVGSTPIRSRAPAGYQYKLTEVSASAAPGTVRVAIDFDGRTQPTAYPLRWGLGGDLAPGQTTTVRGYVNPQTHRHEATFWAGVVQEAGDGETVLAHRLGERRITIGGGSARDPLREFLEGNPTANGTLVLLTGFDVEDFEFYEEHPEIAAAVAASNFIPVTWITRIGGRLFVTGGKEVVEVGGKVVLSRRLETAADAALDLSRIDKGIIGETNLAMLWERLGVNLNRNFVKHHTGLDELGEFAGDLVVGEAKLVGHSDKFSVSHLSRTVDGAVQMSPEWITAKTREMIARGEVEIAQQIQQQLASGRLKRHLIITRYDDRAAGVTDELRNMFDLVLELDTAGNELARYVSIP